MDAIGPAANKALPARGFTHGGVFHADDVFAAAIGCARASGARYVAADIGPLGAKH